MLPIQSNLGGVMKRGAALVAMASSLAVVPAANAALLTVEDSDYLSSEMGGSIMLDRFDPALGILRSVQLDASMQGSGGGSGSGSVSGGISADMQFSLGQIDVFLDDSSDDSCEATGRRESCLIRGLLRDRDSSFTTDQPTLLLFTGLDSFTLTFRASSFGKMDLDSFTANAKVTYRYEQVAEVPEPASTALAGLALLALVGVRSSQRK